MPADTASLGRLLVELLFDDSDFSEGLADAQKQLKTAGDQMGRFATGVQTQVTRVLKGAAIAATAFAAATTVVGSEFQKQMAAVGAVKGLDLASQQFAQLEDRARELGATTAFTATEAARGMEALGRAGLDTSEILQASEVALKLAGAGQVEFGRSAEIVAASMAQFSLQAGEAGRIADVFTVATQNTLFATEDLAQSMKFAGTTGSALGKNIEETVAAVAQFRDLGLEGSQAGVNFRRTMISLAAPTEKAREALDRMGLSIEDVSPATNDFADVMKALGDANISAADANDIFGSRVGLNAKKVADNLSKSTEDFDALTASLEGAAGATADTYDKMMDNVAGQFSILRSAVEETMLGLFDTFKRPLQGFIEAVTLVVGRVNEQLGMASDDIGRSFSSVIDDAAGVLRNNADEIASAVVAAIQTAQALTDVLAPLAIKLGEIGLALSALLPLLDELVILLGIAFGAQKVFAFTSAVLGLVNALGLGTAAATAFGTALTASTGGVALAVAGVAALAAGAGILAARYADSRTEAALLSDVNEQLGTDFEHMDEALTALNAGLEENARKWERLTEEIGHTFEVAEDAIEDELEARIDFLEGLGDERGDFEEKELARLKGELEARTKAEKAKADQDRARRKQLAAEAQALRDAEARDQQAKLDEEAARLKKLRDAVLSLRSAEFSAKVSLLSASDKLIATTEREIDGIRAAAEEAKLAARSEQEREEIATAAAGAIAAANEKLAGDLAAIRRKRIEDEEKAAATAAEIVEENHTKAAEMLAAIQDDRKTLFGEFVSFLGERSAAVLKAAVAVAKRTLQIFGAVTDAARGLFDALTGGFSVDPSAIVDDIVAARSEAEERVADLRSQLADEDDEERRAELEADLAEAKAQARKTAADLAAEQVNAAVDSAITYATTLAETLPAIISQLVERVPDLVDALVAALPDVVKAITENLPDLIDAIIAALPDVLDALLAAIPVLAQAIFEALPDLVSGIVGLLPDLITGLVSLLPDLIVGIIQLIPDLIEAVLEHLPEIAIALITAIVTELLPALPMIALELIKAILKSIGALLKAIVESIKEAIKSVFSRRDRKERGAAREGGGAFSGIDFVPATARMTIHRGEAVIPADRNARRLRGGMQGSAPGGASSGGQVGGGQPIELAILADGRLLEAVQIRAGERGTATKTRSAIRRASGARVGFDKGKFSAWSN